MTAVCHRNAGYCMEGAQQPLLYHNIAGSLGRKFIFRADKIKRNEMIDMLVFLIGGVVLLAVIIAVVASVAGAVAAVTDEEPEE